MAADAISSAGTNGKLQWVETIVNKTRNSDPVYTLEDHCHLFAAWAAARAAQRQLRGGSNGKLINAITASGLPEAVAQRDNWPKTAGQFDEKHREWCARIIDHCDHNHELDLSYGRAAKLVAIYLKCRIITAGHHDTDFGRETTQRGQVLTSRFHLSPLITLLTVE